VKNFFGFHLELFKNIRKITAPYFFGQQIFGYLRCRTVIGVGDIDMRQSLALKDLLVRRWGKQIHNI